MYRASWQSRQEDGTIVTLHSIPYATIAQAKADRDEAMKLNYVIGAWVEHAEWQIVPD
jgi:hypothetical protein